MKTSEIIKKYQAMSQVYHAAGADDLSLKLYEASYAALAEACGGIEVVTAVTAAYARDEELPEYWPGTEPSTAIVPTEYKESIGMGAVGDEAPNTVP